MTPPTPATGRGGWSSGSLFGQSYEPMGAQCGFHETLPVRESHHSLKGARGPGEGGGEKEGVTLLQPHRKIYIYDHESCGNQHIAYIWFLCQDSLHHTRTG